jgi:hypothetical protein
VRGTSYLTGYGARLPKPNDGHGLWSEHRRFRPPCRGGDASNSKGRIATRKSHNVGCPGRQRSLSCSGGGCQRQANVWRSAARS